MYRDTKDSRGKIGSPKRKLYRDARLSSQARVDEEHREGAREKKTQTSSSQITGRECKNKRDTDIFIESEGLYIDKQSTYRTFRRGEEILTTTPQWRWRDKTKPKILSKLPSTKVDNWKKRFPASFLVSRQITEAGLLSLSPSFFSAFFLSLYRSFVPCFFLFCPRDSSYLQTRIPPACLCI